jgi:hypothetical protein
MFYLLNYNNSGSSPLTFAPPSSSNSTDSPYALARYRLLLREARYEGLSRWLGATNQSTVNADGWLNSTYFPEATSNASTAIKVTPFQPQDPEERTVVIKDVLGELMSRNKGELQNDGRVYTQNLTGFVKGGWGARDYTFDQLALNETWYVETRRRRKIEKRPEESGTNSTTTNSTNILEVRQLDSNHPSVAPINSSLPLTNTSLPVNSTFETVTTTFNRTEQRGSFPFTYRPKSFPNEALFNLREVQTSATGPIVPLPEQREIVDDSKLLSLRGEGDWEDWEKKGPVTYLGGELTMSVEDGDYQGQQASLDIEAAQ